MINLSLPGKDAGRIATGVFTGGLSEGVRALTPDIPNPTAPPPVPESNSKETAAAREKQRQAEARRRGRVSTILAGGGGEDLGGGTIARPQARTSRLLGG